MIKQYMSQINVAVFLAYGVLLLFFVFFVFVVYLTWKMDREKIREWEQMPLN